VKVTWFRRTISLSSGVGAPSADWRIREISDCASSPKTHDLRRERIDREVAEHSAHATDALHFKSAEFVIIARG